MNRKFTKYWFVIGENYLLIPIVLLAFIISFIWFGLRPASITESCHSTATKAMGWNENNFYVNTESSIRYQTFFELCTHKAGL